MAADDLVERRRLLGADDGDVDGGEINGDEAGHLDDVKEAEAAGFFASRLRDVVVLGLAFMLIFSAFTVAQNLASSVLPTTVAYWSLGTLYIVFALVTLVASSIVRALGLRHRQWPLDATRVTLFLGGATYVWYTAATSLSLTYATSESMQFAIMIPSAVLLGLGAGSLWTAQGSYLTLCALNHNLGLYNGVFFFLFIMNQLIGNVGAGLLLDWVDLLVWIPTQTVMFNTMAVAGAVGVLGFLLLRPVGAGSAEAADREDRETLLQAGVDPDAFPDAAARRLAALKARLTEVLRLLGKVNMVLLAPAIAYTGLTQAFFPGQIPLFINDFAPSSISDDSVKLYVMACLGACSSFGSLLFGRVSDRFGRLQTLGLAGVFHGLGYCLLLAIDAYNRLDVLLPVACLFGLGDAILNTQLYSILGFVFRSQAAAAFAAFKLLQSMATGILFFLSDAMAGECPDAAPGASEACPNLTVWMPLMLASLATAGAGLLVLRRRGTPLEASADKEAAPASEH